MPRRRTRRALARALGPFTAALAAIVPSAAPPARAQGDCTPELVREIDTIPLYDALGPVPAPWRGGWEKPRPQLLDVDADGDLDLFVAEETGRLRFFRNDGGPASPDFTFVTDDYGGVHELYFERLADIDADGDFDLLVEAPKFPRDDGGGTTFVTGAYLWTNVGTATAPVWSNLSPHPEGWLVDELGDPMGFDNTAPDLVDLDGDGDLDLLSGDRAGAGRVVLWRNVGTPGAPSFRLESEEYAGIQIAPGLCAGEERDAPTPRHGYMQFVFHDLDRDSIPDLFVGDQFNSNVYHWLGTGGAPSPGFSCQTEFFFPDETGNPGLFPQYLMPAFGDLDGDGDDDALLGSGTSGDPGVFLYRNDGSAAVPDLRLVTRDVLPELDLGRTSAPAFGDLDGDGLPDLLLGAGTRQTVTWWGNVGSAAYPEFALFDDDWVPQTGSSWAIPELADLDADGDPDLFVGRSGGGVRYWRNDGTAQSPALHEVLDDPAFGDAAGRLFRSTMDTNPVPRFRDVDGDGDLDVVAGSWDFGGEATLRLYRNDGTPQAHAFVLAEEDWQGLGPLGQQVAPAFGDVDGDGDVDLLVGRLDGTILWLREDGPPGTTRLVPVPGGVGDLDVGAGAVPVLVDLDADGDSDLVVGETGGGLNLWRNVADPPRAPGAFALLAPAPDAPVDGRAGTLFDWEPAFVPGSGAEAIYELRVAAAPDAPPEEWRTIGGLATSEANVRLWRLGFRLADEVWWTVVARNGCARAPVPAPRRAVHATVDVAHQEDPDHPVPFVPPLDDGTLPVTLAIENAWPSPATGPTSIALAIPTPGRVRVTVHDATGRRVATLLDADRAAGRPVVVWDGRDARGRVAGPGVYLVRVEADGGVASRRIVRLR